MTLYLGASTVSGPIRDVKITFVTPVNVKQEPAWYLEPFHGTYNHTIVFDSYNGTWQKSNAFEQVRKVVAPTYIRECVPGAKVAKSSAMAPRMSLMESSAENVEITSAEVKDGKLSVRFNERTGTKSAVKLSTPKGGVEFEIQPFGIVNKSL
jgi:hypothetical protein